MKAGQVRFYHLSGGDNAQTMDNFGEKLHENLYDMRKGA
jgi:hypothetical protein